MDRLKSLPKPVDLRFDQIVPVIRSTMSTLPSSSFLVGINGKCVHARPLAEVRNILSSVSNAVLYFSPPRVEWEKKSVKPSKKGRLAFPAALSALALAALAG